MYQYVRILFSFRKKKHRYHTCCCCEENLQDLFPRKTTKTTKIMGLLPATIGRYTNSNKTC